MTLGPGRWHVIAESGFPWEREALDWLREQLPDREPWHVWTNFEFIDEEGRVNEVDALVLSPAGLFLVEIKSRPGELGGDAHTWTWKTDGRTVSLDNPLLLTNRKAKRLASLLRRQSAITRAKLRLPFVEPAIFLSSTRLHCRLEGVARSGTFQRGCPGAPDDTGLIAALSTGLTRGAWPGLDGQAVRAIARALMEAGIRPSNKHRQVGDYRLGRLLAEGEGYQDWEAQHVNLESVHRRVRIYTVASAGTPELRAARARQARREFEVLEGIDHPGILKVKDYKDTELGPALIFDHDPNAVRLDHLLRDAGHTLSITQRLEWVRDIAETLKYAHAKRLYHRALGPQSILVHGFGGPAVQLRLANWQTAARSAGEAGARESLHYTTGTQHVENYVEDPGRVYLAPETTRADPAHGASLDVFSLGCIAYALFSGQPPAATALELMEKLRAGQGLRLSDVLDGCGARQQALVQLATAPDVISRLDSVKEFLDQLEAVEDELTTPDPEATVEPSVAGNGDRLEGGYTVVRRLGRGASSDALVVRAPGAEEEWVLKVASDPAHNDRLAAEGEVLARLHHQNIVPHRQTLSIAGRTALLLKSAGRRTLAEMLKQEGRLSLDLLQRFGEELIEAVRHLEAEGVAHRDIKPENIGISDGNSGRLKLVLFDFSLCRTPAENISAGTHPYLDPFLALRRPPRWDLYAERFALAVTLYEMAVGQPPIWGDGHTAPALLEAEATIESEVFDPVIREGLTAFFTKALRRDYRQRFDNAEDMLRAWRAVFDQRAPAAEEGQGIAAIALAVTPATTMAELGYSLEAQDVLERIRVHNVRDLLAMDRIRFRYLRGVGDKIRKEIRLLAKELARLRPDLTPARGTLLDAEEDTREAVSVNELAAQLLPRRPAGDDRPEEEALAHYLGLDDAVPAGGWPTLGESATACGLDRDSLAGALLKARERWLRSPPLTLVREQLDTLLQGQGQVMTAEECALALLSLRGCAQQEEAERLRQAHAVLRAALEAESQLAAPRFEAHDHRPCALLATAPAWAHYARQLGAAADGCAAVDPLLPPPRVLDTLERVPLPGALAEQASPPGPARLLRLAASASSRAALSSRQELYPRGMAPLQSLRQSLGALLGAPQLTVQDIQARVRGRYREAAALPGRPELDRLLAEAGAPLVWEPGADGGRGAYRLTPLAAAQTAGTSTVFSRHGTRLSAGLAVDAETAAAAEAERRLTRSLRQGALLVLTVPPRLARRAQSELMRRFGQPGGECPPVRLLDFDALLLGALREQAQAAGVDWSLVLAADAAERDSRHWVNLQRLVQRALPALRTALLHAPTPLLLTSPGLLARYELMGLVTELEQLAGRPSHTPAAWLLVPSAEDGRPVVDGVAVPLVSQSAGFALPQAWLENRHRAGGAAWATAGAARPLPAAGGAAP